MTMMTSFHQSVGKKASRIFGIRFGVCFCSQVLGFQDRVPPGCCDCAVAAGNLKMGAHNSMLDFFFNDEGVPKGQSITDTSSIR